MKDFLKEKGVNVWEKNINTVACYLYTKTIKEVQLSQNFKTTYSFKRICDLKLGVVLKWKAINTENFSAVTDSLS